MHGLKRSASASSVLVVGCGYVGGRLASILAAEDVNVWGLKRDPAALPPGVRPVAADVTRPESLTGLPRDVNAVVYAVAPAGPTPAAYQAAYVDGVRNVLAALGPRPPRLVLVSSTGVYGADDGRVVDEETEPEPRDETGALILAGERVAIEGGDPGIVLRLGGIYGPDRTRTVRQVLANDARCPPPGLYGNRIHRDDAASAIRHLLRLPDPASVYLGVDREPAPLRQVYAWIAERGGVPDPCREPAGEAGPPGGGRRGSNKRCSSRRLVESGFSFQYPTYQEGYGPLVDELAGPPPRGP